MEDLRGPVDCRVEVFQAASLATRFFWVLPQEPDLVFPGTFGPGGVVDLPLSLAAGDAVRVAFTLPGAPATSVFSGLRMVTGGLQPWGGRIFGPVLDCARAVYVTDVLAGTEVVVLAGDTFAGFAFATDGPGVRVGTPALERGELLSCITFVGTGIAGGAGPRVSAEAVLSRLPRVLPGVAVGDRRVWVSGLPPGALVTIEDVNTGAILGRTATSDPILRVPCALAVAGPVRALVAGCDDIIDDIDLVPESAVVTGLPSLRRERLVTSRWFDFGPTDVFTEPTGTEHRCWGQVWRPLVMGRRPRLVVILHGLPTFDERANEDCSGLLTDPSGAPTMSYRGYDEMAQALAAIGCVVVSLKHEPLEGPNKAGFAARALDLLMMPVAHAALALPLGTSLAGARTLLVGHSYGAEAFGSVLGGVVTPAIWQVTQAAGFVALAPYLEPAGSIPPPVSAPMLVFYGSADYLKLGDGPYDWYTSGAGEKTFVYAEGLPHSSWSSVWSGRDVQTDLPDERREGGRRRDARIVAHTGYLPIRWQPHVAEAVADTVVAFAMAWLFDDLAYLPLLRGPVRPEAVEDLGWFVDHVVPATSLSAILQTLSAPGALDWGSPPAAPTSWRSPFLLKLPLLNPTDDLVFTVEVTELDGSLGFDQTWLQPVNGYQTVTNLGLDVLVVLPDGAASAQVRLGAVTRLPGPWRGYGLAIGFPQSIRIPYDAFMATDPGLSPRPDRVVLDLDALVADAAVIVSSLEFQRQ